MPEPRDDDSTGLGWKPGRLARVRALLRRTLLTALGERSERRIHGWYHRLLRVTGRFGPPENADSAATLAAIAARSMTIIDIGANVGRYAWFLRRHAPADARLYAVEPHEGAAELLRAALSELPGSTVVEVGASDADGTAQLVVPDGAFGSPVSGLAWVAGPGGVDQQDQHKIRIRRIDSLVEDGGIAVTGPVFMKIDVEGGEPRVLRGAVELLRRHRPILYFECQAASLARQGETPEGVWDELGRAGYRMFANRSGRFQPVAAVEASTVNYLAIPDVPDDELPGSQVTPTLLDAWAARTSRL